MSLSKSLFISGFLFDREFDFDSSIFSSVFDIINPYDLYLKNDRQLENYFKDIAIKYDHIIGYSLGGQILLKYYSYLENVESIDLIGTHPGGLNDIQRQEAFNFFSQVVAKIENLSIPDFINWWNKLELFKYDLAIDSEVVASNRSSKDILRLFKRWPSYSQADYRYLLLKDNIKHLVYGEFDLKYKALYQGLPSRFKNKEIKGKSHRCFDTKLLVDLNRLHVSGATL